MNCEGSAAPSGLMARGQLCQTVEAQGAGGTKIMKKGRVRRCPNGLMVQGRLRQADKLRGPAVPHILKGQGPAVPTWINGAGPIVQRARGAKHFVQGPAVPIWINSQAEQAVPSLL